MKAKTIEEIAQHGSMDQLMAALFEHEPTPVAAEFVRLNRGVRPEAMSEEGAVHAHHIERPMKWLVQSD